MVAVRQAQAPRQRLFDLDDRPPPPPPGTDTDTETSSYSFVNILRETQYLYALVLLISFITLAAWYSVYNAKKEDIIIESQAKGPGGKPLPITKRKKQDTDERKIGPHFGFAAKNVFRYLAAIVCLTYVGSGASMFVHAFRYDDPYRWSREGLPWAGESSVVNVIGATFFYLYIFVSLFDWRKGPNVVHLTIWCMGFVGEVVMSFSTFVAASQCHFKRVTVYGRDREDDNDSSCVDYWTKIDLVLYFVRILHLMGLISLFSLAWLLKIRRKADEKLEAGNGPAAESTPLLNGTRVSYDTNGSNGNASGNTDDTAAANADGADGTRRSKRRRTLSNAVKDGSGSDKDNSNYGEDADYAAFYRPSKLPRKTWWEYLRGYSLFFPYLWPKDSSKLQLHVMACFGLIMLQRLVNVAVPTQIGAVVNDLEAVIRDVKAGEPLDISSFPIKNFLILGFLWTLQGQSGLLGAFRSLLWIPVSQHSYRGLTTAAFNHVHSLSLDFHLSKRTGEVLSALNKGSAINQFLEQVTFQVFPMLFDLFLSISVFYVKYGALYAEINMVDTCWYLYMTIKMASTRADQRREMTNADREEEAVKNDSISSYETVKYFNAEDFESTRYRDKVATFQTAEAKVQMGMVMMNICQAIVFNLGRIVAAIICGWQVAVGVRTTGDWFTVVSYLTQLQGPLNFFGTFYRTVQQAMISGERLLELFKILPTVVDTPHAKPLENFTGHIKWNNVSFAYDKRKPALKNVSFECLPGTTTAFVGESGGGKSTLFRHMFRYYDCQEGSIELDGQNVKDLTIQSVRQHIGVVPQDTTLFNETLMYNLRYANPDATVEQVYEACKAASIHERILSFPDQYETRVGERGLRLSGGEKQRVAIARTILKDPKIIMLDEATSALDTHTEQEIQDNVWKIGEGRTLLTIAHRLSTITHADQIIVLHAGTVVEKGTHDDLLAQKGRYASMWEKQIRAEKALDAANSAQLKAARAMRRANMNNKLAESSSSSTASGDDCGTSTHAQQEEHTSASSSATSSDTDSTHGDADP